MRFGGLFHGFSFGAGFELMRRVVVPVVLALCILGLWWWLGPEKPSCDSARQHVARSAVEHAVTRMRAEQGDVRRAAVLHLANDPTDFVTLTLRRRLMEGGWLDLDGTPPMEKIRSLLNFRNPSVYDVEKAREYGKENGLDAVIIGNLDQFETTKDSAVLKGLLKFEEEFHKYVSCPVVLSNDANAAAFGEYVYGGARGMDHFVMITLGTGVGSGIVVDGKLVHGFTGTAGELGHNILIPNGRQCSCGRKGCLEAYTSARGIVQTYVELRKEKGTPADAAQHKGWIGAEVPDKEVTSKMIGDAANAGDPLAKATYAQVGEWLGLACANACTFSAPQAIFLMGGPTLVGAPLLEPLKASFEANLLNIYKGHVDIRMSQLKANEVAILGAAALVELRK